MDLKRLPYLPIQYFYFQFDRGQKILFLLALSLVLIAAVFLGFSYENPSYWSLNTYELQNSLPDAAVIEQVESNYRNFEVEFPLYWQQISQAAGPLLPALPPLLVFLCLQVLAWTFVITATTQIKSRWIYLFYFLFLLFIHFSGVHRLWYAEDDLMGRLVEFGIILSFLLPAFLFQVNMLKWSSPLRWLTFFGLSLLWFGLPISRGEIVDAHAFMQGGFYYNLFLFIPFLVYVGKDLVNLIVLVGNNRPQKENRWPFWAIMLVIGLLILIEVLWLHEFFDWGILGDDFQLGIRPTHLLLVAGVFYLFTSQNQYHQVKTLLNSQFVFVLFLAAWSIIVLSFLAICLAGADMIFTYTLDRITAVFFTSVTVFYTFFIVANHSGMLKRRVNFYYLLTQPRDFNFFVIWLLSLGAIVVAEGSERWKSFTLITHTYTLNIGDEAWLKGNMERAEKAYQLATKNVAKSVKGHYNLGALHMLQSNRVNLAIQSYEAAVKKFDFPYAWLNAAQLLNEKGLTDSATAVLLRAEKRMPQQAQITNKLGLNYWESYRPDSAIAAMKRGLRGNPSDPILLSNLGALYYNYERPKEAAKFIQASLDENRTFNGVWTNVLVWQLKEGKRITPSSPEYEKGVSQDFWLTYHHFLNRDLRQRDTLGLSRLKSIANEAYVPEAILLDGWRLLRQDSMELGESRLVYLANTRPKQAPKAYYLLGLAHYEKELESKARYYFSRQADDNGKYLAALMDLDRGFFQAGSEQLTQIRGESDELFQKCSKELALLLKAYGQDIYAQTEWDLSTLDIDERVRIGVYSDSLGQFAYALENFRQAIDFDSASVAPYLEMGRIFNRYGEHEKAVENLSFGLKKNPESKEIRREMAQAYIQLDQQEEAITYMDTASVLEKDRMLLASFKLSQGDTAKAESIWLSVYDKNPLFKEVVLRLLDHYYQTGRFAQGFEFISRALIYNDKNPFYWYQYARFARKLEDPEEAEIGVRKAIDLLPKSETKSMIEKEFEEFLR